MYLKLHNRISRFCVLLAATLVLPILAYADHDGGKGTKVDNDEHRWSAHDKGGDRDGHIPVVPEANAGWVLIPFFGVVLLHSWRQLSRSKA
jgi:hypothetical protein